MVHQYGREFTRKELLLDILQLRLQWHPTLVELSGLTDLRIYNIFSTYDDANRFLHPIGSFMERGGPECAIGACGVSQWPKLISATSAGSLESGVDLVQSNLWNVDASKVIFLTLISTKDALQISCGSSLLYRAHSMQRVKYLHHTENRPRIGPVTATNFRGV